MFFKKELHYSFSHINSFKVCKWEKKKYDFAGNTVVAEYNAIYDEYDPDGNKPIYSFSLERALDFYKKDESIVHKNYVFREDALSFIENFFEYKYIQNPDYIILLNEKFLTHALKMISIQYYLKQKNEEYTILRYDEKFYKSNYLSIQFLVNRFSRDNLIYMNAIIPLLPSSSDSKEFILKYCDLAKDYFSNISSLISYYRSSFRENNYNITKQAITFRKAFIALLKWHVSKERDKYCFLTDYSYNCYCDSCFEYLGLPKEKQLYFEEKEKYMSDFLSIPSDLIFQMSQKIKEYTESIKSKILGNKFLRYIHPYGKIYEEGIAYGMDDISFCKSLDEIADHTKEFIDMCLSLEDGMNELMSDADPRIRNFYNYLNENCVENQNKFKSGYQIMKEMSDWLGELLKKSINNV